MEPIQEVISTVQKLIDNKDISAYKINKDIGIAATTIKQIRQGIHDINKLKFETVIALYEYQKALEK
ncbi:MULTISPECIES: hypothetical protein [Mammaliicoccus]|uniref:hypothetical protein n=1 Tax=Mammaliicoccus TaxID=2803850 RepID=UPI00044835F8|nr:MULTISPECIES: hypothetical protein [Mammaliicoccus]EZX22271.1 hypothetical protein V070_01472 [Staphylococcus aureus C0673]MCJ1749132.1 hypothetical protein [Mammaliicoccus sciuri]MCJ1765750.1 hypothetical protein [Mammaliicoccus sciuri]MCJ1774634.1 hypothetical protein [Mammaliicoccus sciuri]MCJ1782420.1 hypothetical protein [Mammaliicoccus sciuri]